MCPLSVCCLVGLFWDDATACIYIWGNDEVQTNAMWRYNPSTDKLAWIHGDSDITGAAAIGAYPTSGTPDGAFEPNNLPYQRGHKDTTQAASQAATDERSAALLHRAATDKCVHTVLFCSLLGAFGYASDSANGNFYVLGGSMKHPSLGTIVVNQVSDSSTGSVRRIIRA